MDLKEKLKEILKKNYGITSDLGIFVTQIDTEKTA